MFDVKHDGSATICPECGAAYIIDRRTPLHVALLEVIDMAIMVGYANNKPGYTHADYLDKLERLSAQIESFLDEYDNGGYITPAGTAEKE